MKAMLIVIQNDADQFLALIVARVDVRRAPASARQIGSDVFADFLFDRLQ